MTLEEYEKVLEEKRKALQSLKNEERKVDTKEFESMQQLSSKKGNDDVFIKLVSLVLLLLEVFFINFVKPKKFSLPSISINFSSS